MKIPAKIRTYCPKCRKHTQHKVKVKQQRSPAKARKLAWGQRKHDKKAKGYTSKVGRKAKPVKQTKKNVLLLECTECKKKQQRSFVDIKKRVEIKK